MTKAPPPGEGPSSRLGPAGRRRSLAAPDGQQQRDATSGGQLLAPIGDAAHRGHWASLRTTDSRLRVATIATSAAISGTSSTRAPSSVHGTSMTGPPSVATPPA